MRLTWFAATLERFRQQGQIPGMSVAIVRDQEIIFTQGFGYANIEHNIPATPQTAYYIASLTKPIVATALIRLVEQGQLDLDRPVETYWPEFKVFCENQVALWQQPWAAPLGWVNTEAGVLHHSLRDYQCQNYREQLTIRHHLSHTAAGEPGTHFQYNGYLYGRVLKQIAENASGQPLTELLEQTIFIPLQMTQTVTSLESPRAILVRPALATLYHCNYWCRQVPSAYPSLDFNAGSGIISTVEDLAKFDMALMSNKLVSPAGRTVMFRPATSPQGQPFPYGLGWFVQEDQGMVLVWHYAFVPGLASSLMVKVPERKLTFILLANSDGASAPFPLYEGDVRHSPFARLFLKTFLE